jgi:hypothetical protein
MYKSVDEWNCQLEKMFCHLGKPVDYFCSIRFFLESILKIDLVNLNKLTIRLKV